MKKTIFAIFGMLVLCLAGFNLATPQISELTSSAEVGEVISVALNASAVGWTGLVPGTSTDVAATTGGAPLLLSIYAETNVATDLEVNGSDLTSSGNILEVANVSYSNATTGLVALTSGFSSGGFEDWIGIPDPSSTITRDINWFITIPAGIAQGTYTGTLYVKVKAA